jgi:hypothetical protein
MKHISLFIAVFLVSGMINQAWAAKPSKKKCVTTIMTVAKSMYEQTWKGQSAKKIKPQIEALESNDSAEPVQMWVLVSDVGAIDGADKTPRGQLQMAASRSIQVIKSKVSLDGKSTLFKLFGIPSAIGNVLRTISVQSKLGGYGIRLVSNENPFGNPRAQLVVFTPRRAFRNSFNWKEELTKIPFVTVEGIGEVCAKISLIPEALAILKTKYSKLAFIEKAVQFHVPDMQELLGAELLKPLQSSQQSEGGGKK